MVVAYLRGLLRHNHRYGVRSIVTENIVLEALNAELLAENIQSQVSVDMALIPVINQKAVIASVERSASLLSRASDLRLLDIYNVAEQLASATKQSAQNNLSLFQLYQIAEKSGIFAVFDDHYTEDKARPCL